MKFKDLGFEPLPSPLPEPLIIPREAVELVDEHRAAFGHMVCNLAGASPGDQLATQEQLDRMGLIRDALKRAVDTPKPFRDQAYNVTHQAQPRHRPYFAQ